MLRVAAEGPSRQETFIGERFIYSFQGRILITDS